jgi:hypothetical protein
MNLTLGYQLAERIIDNASSSAVSVYEIQREESKIKEGEMTEHARRIYREYTRDLVSKIGSLYATTKWLCTLYNVIGQTKVKSDDYFNNLHTIIHHNKYVHINKLVGKDIQKTFDTGLRLIVQENDFCIPTRDLDMMVVAADDYYTASEELKLMPNSNDLLLSDVWGEMTMSDMDRVEYMSSQQKIHEMIAKKNNKYKLFKSVGESIIQKLMLKSDYINLEPKHIRDILHMDKQFKATGLGDYNVNDFDFGYNTEHCKIIRMLH